MDDGVSVSVSREILIDFALRRGDEISGEKMAEIHDAQMYHDAYSAAVRLVAYRMRTASELEQRLLKKNFPPAIGARVVERFAYLGLVDDSKFADAFITSKIASKPIGKRELERRLREKGIDKELARRSVAEVSTEENQMELALRAGESKLRSLRDSDVNRLREKLVAFLMRRGFEWEIVRKVVRKLINGDPDAMDS